MEWHGDDGPNAAPAMVVDYPDGTRTVTQAKAGADGHYSATPAIPAKVHVLVDSNGTAAQGTCTIA